MLYSDNTHLVADSLEELHLFCKKVGSTEILHISKKLLENEY